jgi:hypothetical protein
LRGAVAISAAADNARPARGLDVAVAVSVVYGVTVAAGVL